MSLKILSLPTIPYFPTIPTISYLSFEISLLGSGLCGDLTVRNSNTGNEKPNKSSRKNDTFFRVREEKLFFTSPPPDFFNALCSFTRVIFFDNKMFIPTHFYTVGKGLLYTVSLL